MLRSVADIAIFLENAARQGTPSDQIVAALAQSSDHCALAMFVMHQLNDLLYRRTQCDCWCPLGDSSSVSDVDTRPGSLEFMDTAALHRRIATNLISQGAQNLDGKFPRALPLAIPSNCVTVAGFVDHSPFLFNLQRNNTSHEDLADTSHDGMWNISAGESCYEPFSPSVCRETFDEVSAEMPRDSIGK